MKRARSDWTKQRWRGKEEGTKLASFGPNQRTVGRMTMKSTRRVIGHSILRSLVRSHRSLSRLLRTARFARALRCAHSFAHSLTHSWARGKVVFVYRRDASISYHLNPLRARPPTVVTLSSESESGELFSWISWNVIFILFRGGPNLKNAEKGNQLTEYLKLFLKSWTEIGILPTTLILYCKFTNLPLHWHFTMSLYNVVANNVKPYCKWKYSCDGSGLSIKNIPLQGTHQRKLNIPLQGAYQWKWNLSLCKALIDWSEREPRGL